MMKKYYYGTVAAVACLGFAAVAQAEDGKIKLSLGGYYNGMVAFTTSMGMNAATNSAATPKSISKAR